jgi:NAD(P)-dependent dehydrogenase (short-subunit alcohol dehydrogenase family)
MTASSATRAEPDVLSLFNLSGRVAMVTGAGGHLGSAISRALAEAGARVIVTSRDARRAASIAAELPDADRVRHVGVELDQTDFVSVDRCIASGLEAAGQIDVLVNNAHEPLSDDWESVNAEEFQRHLANLTGYFLLARHVRNEAVKHKRPATIIMIGSMYGVVGSYPNAYEGLVAASPAAYHALKGGIVQLTRHLAVYWARDAIRVNCLSPGPFPSAAASPQMVERLKAKSPMGRMGDPSELKGAVLLLASNAGSYITGQNLIVDGGWTAW